MKFPGADPKNSEIIELWRLSIVLIIIKWLFLSTVLITIIIYSGDAVKDILLQGMCHALIKLTILLLHSVFIGNFLVGAKKVSKTCLL